MSELPTGTVTFLFTDLEGSTRLWEEHPDAMKEALARHDAILDDAVARHGGHVVKHTGDGVHAAFTTADSAVLAATSAQLALQGDDWAGTGPLRVRMGLHTGTAQLRDGDYFGSTLNRAARLMAVGHGGQIVVSRATAELIGDGVEPVTFRDLGHHGLRDLARREQLFQVCHPELLHEFPPLRSIDSFPGNLPIQVTRFVGREREVAEVVVALTEARVVTLTGVGGVGKTRLALQVAAEAVPGYQHGAWLCELAPIGMADALVEALAATLGAQPGLGQSVEDSVFDFLRSKALLLVLDNCEHLLEPVAQLVERIVHACARVSVLTTSREGLGVAGERMIALASLTTPALDAPLDVVTQSDAVRLFVERAADAKAHFDVTSENAGAIGQICRRLDGIPLAIELAAARVQVMNPSEIAARLDDQFRLLGSGRRTAVERHQTLRRAIDWSYDLLTPSEQVVLQRLAVFAGGCTLDAAEGIVPGDDIDPLGILDHLATLVRRSLVVADGAGRETRYRLLETIRQYAHQRLEESGDAEAVQRRHAEHFAELAEEAGVQLRSADQLAWLARLEPEIDNLRAAFAWATDHDFIALASQIVVPLCLNGVALGFTALDWAAALATNPSVDKQPLGPALLGHAAWRALMRADYDRARALEARACAAETALGLPPHSATLQARATIALFTDHADEAVEHARRWVDVARARGDAYDTVQSLTMLASALTSQGTPDAAAQANAVADEATIEARRLGNPSNLSWTLVGLSIPLSQTEPERAAAFLQEAIDVGTAVGNHHGVGMALAMLGWIYTELGDDRAALLAFLRAFEGLVASGSTGGFVGQLTGLARTFVTLGEHEAAAIVQGSADAHADVLPEQGPMGEARVASLASLSDALGTERLTELLARGGAMSDEEAVEYSRREAERILAD